MTRTASHHLLVSLVTLGDPDTLTGGYLYHRRLAELAPRHGARLVFASFPSWPFLFPAVYGPRLLAVLSAQEADVVILDSIAAAFFAPWIAAVRVPVLAMLHQPPGGIDHSPVRRRVQAAFDQVAYRRAERVLVASQLLADQLSSTGFGGRLLVVPPGRDVAAAPHGHKRDLRGGARAALLCVGNWVTRKGILQALDAVARLPDRLVRLHLVGDDRPDPRYAARVRRRLAGGDLAGRVEYHGRLAREEVAAMYRDADVFVLPSVREPYGTVYGEAMAAGLPVVGWRAGNLPYLAAHGREGLLVTPGDVPGLVSALRRLAEDGELCTRLGTAARLRAAAFPTWEQSAGQFFAAAREAARRRASPPTSPHYGLPAGPVFLAGLRRAGSRPAQCGVILPGSALRGLVGHVRLRFAPSGTDRRQQPVYPLGHARPPTRGRLAQPPRGRQDGRPSAAGNYAPLHALT